MFIQGCIGDLCHLPVVDPQYVFVGGVSVLWVLHDRGVFVGESKTHIKLYQNM